MLSLRLLQTRFCRPALAPVALAPVARTLVALALVFAASAVPAAARAAEPLPQPSGKVILTLSGNIAVTNAAGGEARFDIDMLRAVGEHTLKSTDPFAPGIHTFKGVLLSDLLDRVGVKGAMITAKALDNYIVELPVKDARDYPVLLALEQNGKTMRVRDRGPVRMIYPIEDYPELKTQKYEARAVWQLNLLIVR